MRSYASTYHDIVKEKDLLLTPSILRTHHQSSTWERQCKCGPAPSDNPTDLLAHSIVRWTNANGAQSLQLLKERLERAYQARSLGRWSVNCRVYHSTLATTATTGLASTTISAITSTSEASDTRAPLYFIQSSSWKSQVYAVVSGRLVVAAGRELEAILNKLRNLWTVRQIAMIEGFIYEMGDLLLRAGNLMVSQIHRGLVVELEYLPSRTPGRCRDALEALLRDLLPPGASWTSLAAHELLPNETSEPAPEQLPSPPPKHYDTRSPPVPAWERLGLSSRECTSAHAAYLCVRLLQRDRLL
jgi:mediator of RNA polymerase II transcription subunit 20